MISYNDIKHVELELSSYCNANCPLCPRNLFGYTYNTGYTAKHLTLAEVKQILEPEFILQLDKVTFEGNYGDPLMNPELLDIVNYINKPIELFTNASMQTKTFWQKLAKTKTTVYFALDGLSDTHSIYRQKTDYNKIIANATAFINAGGIAIWKMIEFDHNKHQIDDCEKLSKQLGFKKFIVVDHGRNSGPVFDDDGNLVRVLGDFTGSTELEHYIDIIDNGDMFIEDIWDKPKNNISCQTITGKSIYISSEGEVYPCCFMGFNPRKYGKGRWHQPVNAQISELLEPNNALERPLQECIEWFNKIPACWNKSTFEDSRLIVCDASCGI
jgi:MoaA/NifB/PqqE/SkfB family radical SAM enzyme